MLCVDVDTAIFMNTAVIYTLNDQSNPTSWLVSLFGDPNVYVWRQANLSAYSDVRFRSSDVYHAVAIDAYEAKIYYVNNVNGTVQSTRIYGNDTQTWYYRAAPITKRVNFTDVSPHRRVNLPPCDRSGCKYLGGHGNATHTIHGSFEKNVSVHTGKATVWG